MSLGKKYQIFISSTYKDLKTQRTKVRDAILRLNDFPVGMEMFGARDEKQWEIIKEQIDTSDYYVLIIGKCFGSQVPGEDISYTQKEYRYAKERRIPILAFIIEDDAPVPPSFEDIEPELVTKLKKFIREVKSDRTVDSWSNADELAMKVITSLTLQKQSKPRPGWTRIEGFDIEASQAELVRQNVRIRELEEENAVLRSSTEMREPKLNIRLLNTVKIRIKNVELEPIILDDEMEQLINSRSDKAYFITHDYRKYTDARKRRRDIIASHTGLDFFVENTGTKAATNITIEMEIPPDLRVYEDLDLGRLSAVTVPNRLKGHVKNPLWNESTELDRDDYPNEFFGIKPVTGWSLNRDKLSVEVDYIRQYSKAKCDKFFMITNKAGRYELKFRIMCAEMKEPVEQILYVDAVKA